MNDKLAAILSLCLVFLLGIAAGVRLCVWHLFHCCYCRREIKFKLISAPQHEDGKCHRDDSHKHHGQGMP